MAVVSTIRIPGLPVEMYHGANEQLEPRVKEAKGFILHTAVQDGSGITIYEVWDSQDDANNWYDNVVRPATQQMGAPQFTPEFSEALAVIRP